MQWAFLARARVRLLLGPRIGRSQTFSTRPHPSLASKCDTSRRDGGSIKSRCVDYHLFNYTSGRWLYNEHFRLAERRLRFNVDELCSVVARSVGRHDTEIVLFSKIAEGGSYRIFEAIFRDELKVIAPLPYPSTIPRHYGIASEVTTIELLRLHGVPAPGVFEWSSSTSNSVGCEYIIIERVQGKELDDSWFTMNLKQRMAVIQKIVKVETALMKIEFPANGSIFFKSSLDAGARVDMAPNDSSIDVSKFCIGPSTEYLWWYNERNKLAVDHGSWRNTEAVMKAVGERECKWLQMFGKMRFPWEPLYREFYGRQKVDPKIQVGHLRDYLKIVPHLIPQEEDLNKPTMRHHDFSPSNIFVSDSGEITGILDWQHTTVLPIFLQAKIPKHFQNYGDDDSENFRPPKLPANFETLDDSDKEREKEVYRRRQVHYFYLGFTNRLNPAHFHAMGKYNLILRNQLYDAAGRPWEGDSTSLQAALIKTLSHWSEIVSSEDGQGDPPVQFSQADIHQCLDRNTKQKEADSQMEQLRHFIGVNIDGWVPTGVFDSAREKSQHVKRQMLEAAETEEERIELEQHWPFQDHEEID